MISITNHEPRGPDSRDAALEDGILCLLGLKAAAAALVPLI